MSNKLTIGIAALLVASATLARAQGTQQQAPASTAPSATSTSGGTIDIGGRFTSTDGDEARYERYRDLRDGVNANFSWGRATPNWTFDAFAKNIGYRDGHYELTLNSHKFKVRAFFDQIPLNYAYYTKTPYQCSAGDCSLDPDLRAQVQAKTAIGVPQVAGQLAAGSIYNTIAQPFDLKSRRDTIFAEVRYSATDNLDLIVAVNSFKRTGNQPWGEAFAFNVATELPMVIDNRETDWTAGVEWASHQGSFHVDYQHDKFEQNVPSFRWDNPQRATDYCVYNPTNPALPPGACYDPSGYTNGNGPAFGLLATAPSTSADRVNLLGMVKLPRRTTANASFSMGANRQDAALIPWTTNSSINTPAVFAAFPGIAELPRDSARMYVNYATGTANVSNRAIKDVVVTARYRFNSRSDFTREFDAVEYVRFDAVPEETGGPTEPFSWNRNTVDVNATYTGIKNSAIRVGYGYDRFEHGVRFTEGWRDNTARVSYDFIGNQYVTLRAIYEHTKRDSVDFNVEDSVGSGMQPAARMYDEAARKRDRVSFVVDATPIDTVGVNFTYAHAKDNYTDPGQEFGLLDNKNDAFTIGVNYAPKSTFNVGVDYGHTTYDAFQESRNANPAPDPSWTDPNRNWSLANNEKVNNFTAYLNLIKAIAKTDIRATYDFSDSDQSFVHGGPRIAALSALNTFVPLPNVTNKWHRATVDLVYALSDKLGIGASYWYEKFDVSDFATINTAGPQTLPRPELGPQTDTARIDWLGAITTGYGNRPYTGHTAFVRLFYHF
jgi:hypothetical protein